MFRIFLSANKTSLFECVGPFASKINYRMNLNVIADIYTCEYNCLQQHLKLSRVQLESQKGLLWAAK